MTRLRAATRRSAFGVFGQQAAAGPVSESHVRLQRVIPLMRNSFKPFFFGRFEARGDGVYLTGRFTMLWFVKAFTTVWLGIALAIGIASALALIDTHDGRWQLALGALGMFGAGVALIAFCKWLARNDVAWLSNIIHTALGAPVVVQESGLSAGVASSAYSTSSVPTVLRVTALVLLFMGVMGVCSAISGVSSWHASSGHATITHYSSWPLRLAIGAYALWTLGLAFGVYRRKQWAWRLGLLFFGAAGLTSILQAFAAPQFPDSAIVRAVFCVLSLAVTLYWGWWWYAQRTHFSSEADPLLRSQP